MPKYTIPYGQSHTEFNLDNRNPADVIIPPVTTSLSKAEIDQKLDWALSNPLGGITLESYKEAKTVAIRFPTGLCCLPC